MHNLSRKLASCLLVLILALGCGWVVSAAAEETVTLVWSFWGDPGELPPNDRVIEAFEAKYPHIKIEKQHAPWSSYFDRIQTQMAGGVAPDVMFLNNIPSYASRGVLMPLDDLIAETGYDISPYYPELLRIFTFNDVVYGFPRDNDTTVFYYNKGLFDETGVAYPDGSWTWDDFLEAAKKLTKTDARGRTTQYAVALENNTYPVWVYQNDGKVFDDAMYPSEFMLHEPKGVEAIQFIADLINEYKVAPSFAQMLQLGSSTDLFQSGRVAMAMTNAARIPSFQQAKFEWGIAPLLAGPTGIRANTMGGAGYVISANTKHPEEAWTFLRFLAGEEGQAIFASTGVAVPAYRSDTTREAFVSAVPGGYGHVFINETENGVLFPIFDGWVEVSTSIVNPALDLIWIGEKTAADALADIADEVQAYLDSKR
ncbi:MAG: sugar ABC transporter substrate-binding protein [Firmicutes bacterium]|nr:sugar ABC transporter substrate-binding protein [Bacillota bacterium]